MPGYITRVRKNAVQVLIPSFGVEGPVYMTPTDPDTLAPQLKFNADNLTLTITSSNNQVASAVILDFAMKKVTDCISKGENTI